MSNTTASVRRNMVIQNLLLNSNVIFTTTKQLESEKNRFGGKVQSIIRINEDNWAIVLSN